MLVFLCADLFLVWLPTKWDSVSYDTCTGTYCHISCATTNIYLSHKKCHCTSRYVVRMIKQTYVMAVIRV